MVRLRWVLGVLLLHAAACGGDERDDEPGLSVGSLTQSSVSAGTEAEDPGETGDAKLDVGFDSDGPDSGSPDGPSEGCEKVDFLFVIDGSGSMGDNQDSLIASFPGFIESIRTSLDAAQDYHIMVVDTDAAWGSACGAFCALGTCPIIPQYPCETGPPSDCDTQLGAGVNYTMASDAPNVYCNFAGGRRFMDSTEPDLTAAFECAAKVGSDGDSSERPMGAMVAAFSEDLGQPGGCNEGFVRDDAILVVTIITDEEDSNSNGTPEGWYANIIASKAGDPESIVMLGLINDVDQPNPLCPAESQDPVKLRSFFDMFPNAIRGSVCEPTYNSFFQDAVDLIATTCEEFVPPEG
ncbi:MAG: hypothetical protein NXI35_26200 [bacterium]|nr:hypothetical protein [bacterium]